ncbi:MAG: outer membrane protein assembly factor BamE [Caulobacteraceae bacterium]|nr:outer membrane protein assembly factor BamE [Caulobacteraceae bacterium]
MLPKVTFALLSLALAGAAACSPTNSFQGFQAVEQAPADVKVGEDTRSTVLARLGSPTTTSAFDKDTWFYVSQVSNKTAFYRPRVTKRDVVAIAFEKGADQVATVDTFTLRDGRVIAYNGRETPTRGREMTVLEQLLGNLGSISALPPDDTQTPGSHPDDRR